MAQTPDQLLEREFKATKSALRTNENIIHKEELWPEFTRPIGKPYKVKGIAEDSIFSVLNNTEVRGLGGYKPQIYVYDVGRVPKKDPEGNKVTKPTSPPKDSLFIRSKDKITIPARFKQGTNGFDYANYWKDAPDGYHYIWAIPKENIYPMNEVALSVSTRTMKAYKSYQFSTWQYGEIYISVIPYNANAKYEATRILSVGTDLDFDEKITYLVNSLIYIGIIPNVADYYVDMQERNLVMKEMIPHYIDFESESETPLSDPNTLLVEANHD